MRDELLQQIALLLERQPEVFGASVHQFVLDEPLSVSEIEVFERRHCILLPEDYRWFITNAGNGGAGPYYGVFPLGAMDDGNEISSWEEGHAIVGSLAEPFPHDAAWNDLSLEPADDLAESDEAAYEAQLESFEEAYFSPRVTQGAIPICHLGCAHRVWLVISGAERGHLWLDKRADREGLEPIAGAQNKRTSFLEWYQNWVDSSLREPPTAEPFEEAFSRAAPEPPAPSIPFLERLRAWWHA
jgi:hypothetical protein